MGKDRGHTVSKEMPIVDEPEGQLLGVVAPLGSCPCYPYMVVFISDYDKLYRLTDEVIGGGVGPTGAVNYQYDAVGNRLSRTSTLAGQTNQAFGYDNNDRILTDTFDNNGNTVASNGNTDEYDFKNRLIRRTQADGTIIDILYDGDGNRVAKTVTPFGGQSAATKYLIDTNNLTGFAQVLEEIESGAVVRVYTYGLDLISIDQDTGGQFEISYYLYDGLGSVRGLTDLNSNLTDTYTYDAFGNPLTATGTTPNNYRFTGEQLDPDLGLYFLRARYLNPETGRFHTLDTFEGFNQDPLSLHKYLYANVNPVNFTDPTGKFSLAEIQSNLAAFGNLLKISVINIGRFLAVKFNTSLLNIGVRILLRTGQISSKFPSNAGLIQRVFSGGAQFGAKLFRILATMSRSAIAIQRGSKGGIAVFEIGTKISVSFRKFSTAKVATLQVVGLFKEVIKIRFLK